MRNLLVNLACGGIRNDTASITLWRCTVHGWARSARLSALSVADVLESLDSQGFAVKGPSMSVHQVVEKHGVALSEVYSAIVKPHPELDAPQPKSELSPPRTSSLRAEVRPPDATLPQ